MANYPGLFSSVRSSSDPTTKLELVCCIPILSRRINTSLLAATGRRMQKAPARGNFAEIEITSDA